MARQLVLMDPVVLMDAGSVDWRLDEHTRRLGRLGIADARSALREATRRAALERCPTAA
jgi:hypothetical protein